MAATVIPLLALAIIVFVLWVAIRATIEARRNPHPTENTRRSEEERRRVSESLRDALSRKALGAMLAEALWRKLETETPGNGLIHQYHRDYCGHGLIRTETGVMLCEVQDGGAYFSAPVTEWQDAADFVAFFARQSDFSMSGWDAGEPVFFTEDDWHRNNQRLTRAVLEHYLSRL